LKFPKAIKRHIDSISVIDEELKKIYQFIFEFDSVNLPQYMKHKYGFDYEDVFEIKSRLDMYSPELSKICDDLKMDEHIDNYYIL